MESHEWEWSLHHLMEELQLHRQNRRLCSTICLLFTPRWEPPCRMHSHAVLMVQRLTIAAGHRHWESRRIASLPAEDQCSTLDIRQGQNGCPIQAF